MKTTIKILAIALVAFSYTQILAQDENPASAQKAQKVKTKSNSANDRELATGMASGIMIHIDTDENGNDLVFIPTSPAPTVLTLDTQTQTFKAVKGKIKAAQPSSDKRMHKPFVITKELDKKFKMTSDEDGDIDISAWGAGNYELKIAENTEGIKFYIDENHRTYTGGR